MRFPLTLALSHVGERGEGRLERAYPARCARAPFVSKGAFGPLCPSDISPASGGKRTPATFRPLVGATLEGGG